MIITVKPTLYALNKDGSYQQWDIFTQGAVVVVHFGKMGGKVQEKRTVCEGKNIGRSNETTPEDQAIAEAISKWEKQIRLGYRESIESLISEEQYSPMLAKDATNHKDKIEYPCSVQPKLDGLRCLVTLDEEYNPTFNSRGNKTYPVKGKIVEQLRELGAATGHKMFDGEIYLHGLSLQKIVSLAKKWRTQEEIQKEIDKDYQADLKRQAKAIQTGAKTYKNFAKREVSVDVDPVRDDLRYGGYESADLEFHIFDIPSKNKAWYVAPSEDTAAWSDCRLTDLMLARLESSGNSHLKFVSGDILSSEEEVKEHIGRYMQQGYEGIMIRNFKGLYEFNQRSYDLLKWKLFQTIEALVIDYSIDKNEEAVLVCRLESGVTVECKMKGDHEYRKNSSSLVDKFIIIRFQAYTEDGNLQFPVGIAERDVDPVTWEVQE